MKTLIAFEFNKFFKRKKNLIGLALFAVFIFSSIRLNNYSDKMISDTELPSCDNEIKSVQQALESSKSQYDKKISKNDPTASDEKEIIEYYENNLNLLNEKRQAIKSGDWKTKLKISIQMDKTDLEGVKEGTTFGPDPKKLQDRINLNELLLSKNIIPINDSCSMQAFNFLKLAGTDIISLYLIILLFLLTSDSVSNETDEGTFKLLLTQPLSRNKVILSKIISYTLICIASITVILFAFFLGLGFTKGFGSPYYPTAYYTGSFSSIFSSSASNKIIMIDVSRFLLYMLPLYLLIIIAISAMGVLISTLINNSTGAICTSIIVYVTFYIFSSQTKFLNDIAHFIPFTYTNILGILDGTVATKLENSSVTYINGIIVLLIFTIICYS